MMNWKKLGAAEEIVYEPERSVLGHLMALLIIKTAAIVFRHMNTDTSSLFPQATLLQRHRRHYTTVFSARLLMNSYLNFMCYLVRLLFKELLLIKHTRSSSVDQCNILVHTRLSQQLLEDKYKNLLQTVPQKMDCNSSSSHLHLGPRTTGPKYISLFSYNFSLIQWCIISAGAKMAPY